MGLLGFLQARGATVPVLARMFSLIQGVFGSMLAKFTAAPFYSKKWTATVHKCAKGYQQPCSKWSGKAWVADPKWKPRVTGQDLDHGYTVKGRWLCSGIMRNAG